MRIKWLVNILFLLGSVSLSSCSEDRRDSIDEKGWSDPNDPTLAHRPKQSHSLSTCQKSQDQSLRLIIRQIMHDMQIDPSFPDVVRRKMEVKITKHQMIAISKYLDENNEDTQEMRETLRSSLKNIFRAVEDIPETTWLDTVNSMQALILPLNLIILPAAALNTARSVMRPKNFWIVVVSTIIMFSMYSGYNKKWQEAEARKFAQFEEQQSSAKACASEGIFSRFTEILSSPFVYKQKSKCLQYIESQTVDIFHEISIIEVFSETVAGGFFAVLSSAGKHFKVFFRDLYEGAPIMAQIMTTIILLLMFGTIRTPLFTYEPLLLTFLSSSMGKITGWLEGGEDETNRNMVQAPPNRQQQRIEGVEEVSRNRLEGPSAPQQSITDGKEKKRSKKMEIKSKTVEAPLSEREDQKMSEKQKKDSGKDFKNPEKEEKKRLDESSEDEEEEKFTDSETEWIEARNASSLSESSI